MRGLNRRNETDTTPTDRHRSGRFRECGRMVGRAIGHAALQFVVAVTLVTQSAVAQEGIQAAADAVCVDRVASLASLGFYSIALASGIFGLYLIILPKTDGDMSKRDARSSRRQGLIMIGVAALAGAIPPILAGAGIIDLTGCVAPGNIG